MRAPLAGSFRPLLAGLISTHDAVEDVPGQGVELLDFEQARPDPAAAIPAPRGTEKDELGLENTPEIPIGAVETALANASAI